MTSPWTYTPFQMNGYPETRHYSLRPIKAAITKHHLSSHGFLDSKTDILSDSFSDKIIENIDKSLANQRPDHDIEIWQSITRYIEISTQYEG